MPWSIRLSVIEVVVGILQRSEKILVGKRPEDKPYGGYWEFPGGKVDEGELPYHALKRELKEELGITVLDADLWFEHCHQYPDKTVLLKVWRVRAFLNEPESKEGQQLLWASLSDIVNLRLLDGNWPIIDKMKLRD